MLIKLILSVVLVVFISGCQTTPTTNTTAQLESKVEKETRKYLKKEVDAKNLVVQDLETLPKKVALDYLNTNFKYIDSTEYAKKTNELNNKMQSQPSYLSPKEQNKTMQEIQQDHEEHMKKMQRALKDYLEYIKEYQSNHRGTRDCKFEKENLNLFVQKYKQEKAIVATERTYLGLLPVVYKKAFFSKNSTNNAVGITSHINSQGHIVGPYQFEAGMNYLGACAIILRPEDNIKKVVSALYSLGIKPNEW